ncbi:MAG: ABC transporter substrate-binding protein [Oscillospiraceae bacterium]|nr:ABC transporter substrate-binding protein [Oscillospiraceae bacterium]
MKAKRVRSRRVLGFVLSVAVTWAAGCSLFQSDDTADITDVHETYTDIQPYPVTVDGVVIEESPLKIVSLSPVLTEILFEFGYGDRLIGRSRYCDYPTGVNAIKQVKSGSEFDVAQIIGISPDLLLLSAPITDKDRVELQRAGVATVVIAAPRTIEEFRNIYDTFGVILYGAFLGKEKGESAFSGITQACNNPYVLDLGNYIYVTENLSVATGDTLESAILSRFGYNLASNGNGYVFDLAYLTEHQPDVVLINEAIGLDKVKKHEVFSRLDAVAQGRVIVINNAYFERPSSRMIELIDYIRIQHRTL